jgi:hypothetical protein
MAKTYRPEELAEIRPLGLHFVLTVANGDTKVLSDALHKKTNQKLLHNLRSILDGIIDTGRLDPSKELDYFLKSLSSSHKVGFRLAKGRIIALESATKLTAKELIEGYISGMEGAYPGSLRDFSIYLVNALNDLDFHLLRKCQWCNKYFCASKNDERIKYCSLCSQKTKMTKVQKREYERKRRQTRKFERKEAKARSLMKRGMTREEAESAYEDGVA